MNTNINYIKENILRYQICFSHIGWIVRENYDDFNYLRINEGLAQELIALLKNANKVE